VLAPLGWGRKHRRSKRAERRDLPDAGDGLNHLGALRRQRSELQAVDLPLEELFVVAKVTIGFNRRSDVRMTHDPLNRPGIASSTEHVGRGRVTGVMEADCRDDSVRVQLHVALGAAA
jgi:hypothetical protein